MKNRTTMSAMIGSEKGMRLKFIDNHNQTNTAKRMLANEAKDTEYIS